MKKALAILLSILLLMACVPLSAIPVFAATSGTTGDCTWTLDGTHLTISGNGSMASYEFWHDPAPWGTSITTVTIEDGVTSIGAAAFCDCSPLTSVTIPDSVTSIGDDAFCGCSSLTSLTIPDSVTSIGDGAFCACSSLISVTIPDSVTSIDGRAFYNCPSLISVTIPDSVTSIGYMAFGDCSSLTSVTIPDSVITIGKYAFEYCSSLTTVTIGDSVTSIGDYAFAYCESLTEITIPDSVTSIGDSAFYSCDCLTDVYYTGSQADRANISVGDYNDYLLDATWHYAKVDEPVTPPTVIENTNFNDGELNGWNSSSDISVEDGVLVFNCTRDWGNIYKYANGMTANTDYVYTLRAKANMRTTMNIKINDNWTKDTAHVKFDVTTEWQEFTVDVNSGDYQSAAILLFQINVLASTGLVFYLDYVTITEGNCAHSYDAVVTAPDCVNGGYTVYTCSVCGDSYVANYTAALGHTAGAAADCTNPQVCTVCGKVLNAALGHTYDNVCDTDCNLCGATRIAPHVYDGDCDNTCNVCGFTRVAPHTYVNACDRDCNLCGVTRIAPHVYDGDCDNICNLCGNKRQSTADHVYTDDCDATCNVCGAVRTELGHVYTDNCDRDCNHCGALREPPHHYGEKYDPTCDVCGAWREIVIVYGDANGDDSVDVRDITLLQQYLAGWDVTLDVVAADANGDGSVTIRDIILLQQYLAGWSTTLG